MLRVLEWGYLVFTPTVCALVGAAVVGVREALGCDD